MNQYTRTPLKSAASASPATTPQLSAQDDRKTPLRKRPTIDEALRAPVSIEFDKTHISRIVEFLADYAGTNIVIDHRAVQPARNSYDPPKGTMWASPTPESRKIDPEISDGILPGREYKHAKPGAILDDWTKELKLSHRVLPARVFISTEEQMEKDGSLLDTDAMQGVLQVDIKGALDNPIEFSNANEHIAVAAERLSMQIGVQITVDSRIVAPPPNAPMVSYAQPMALRPAPPVEPVADDQDLDRQYTTDGIVNNIKLENVPLAEALEFLATPLNLAYSAKPNYIWITSRERAGVDEFADAPAPPDADAMAKALQNSVTIEFDNTHISRILEFIADYISINIVLDRRAVPGPVARRQQNMAYLTKVGDKYVPTGYVPYIKLENVPLKEALKSLLIPLGLTYKVDKHLVYVSTPQLLAAGSSPHDTATTSSSRVSPIDAGSNPDARNAEGGLPSSNSTDIEGIPVLSDAEFKRLGLPILRINIVGLPTESNPRASAIVNLEKLYEGDVISKTKARINRIEPRGLTLDLDGQKYFLPRRVESTTTSSIDTPTTPATPVPTEAQPAEVVASSRQDQGRAEQTGSTAGDAPTSKPAWPSIADALSTPISIEFDNAHISIITRYIAKGLGKHRVNLLIDPRVVKPAPVGVIGLPGLPGSPLPAPGSPASSVPPPIQPTEPTDPAIEAMYVTDGIVPYVKLVDVPLGEALGAILRPLGLAYEVHPYFIWITSKDRLGAAEWPDAVVPESGPFANKLNASIAFEFDNAHITNILEFVGEYVGVEFKFDARAVPPIVSGQPGQATPIFAMKEGKPSPTGYVSYIGIQRAPLGESLKALLIPLGLTYCSGPGYLIVTSPDLARDTKPEEWANIPYLTDDVPAPAQSASAKSAATPVGPVNDTSAPAGIRLIRIVKWSDGGYRAEIASDLSPRFRRYAAGEVFEHYRVRSIDPQAGTVSVYSSKLEKEFALRVQP